MKSIPFLILAAILLAPARAETTNNPAQHYVLNALDKLTVQIEQDPVPGRPIEIAVSSLFNLDVPVSRCCEPVISINVRGKTVSQVESEVKTRLEQDYYQKADIHLRLVETDPNRRVGHVWLRGAVKGNIVALEAGKPKTLWEALTQVGTTEFAKLSKVRVDRVDPATGETKKIYVDVDAVNKGDRSKDIELQDGDRVTVAEKWFNL